MLKHTLFLLLAILSLCLAGNAQARGETKSAAFAADLHGAQGSAKYEMIKSKDAVSQTLIVEARIEAGPDQREFKVIIDGRTVGLLKVDQEGRGRLELSVKSKPSEAGRLIPLVEHGSTVHAVDGAGEITFKGFFKKT